MRVLQWLYGKKEREKKEKKEKEKEKREKFEKMPDFRKIFCSLPNIVEATISKPREIETRPTTSVEERAAAKSAAQKEAKAEASKIKVDDIYTRIVTAKNKNLEIVWLLQTDKDVPFESLSELIENYRNAKDSDLYRGMSVSYAHKGELREISPLNEQDLEGLAKKLERSK